MAEFKLKQTAEEVQRAVDNGLSFGDMPTGGDTLYWDGNTEGLVCVSDAIYKVSDATPSYDEATNYNLNFVSGSENIIITAEEVPVAWITEGVSYILGEGVIVFVEDSTSDGATKGVYFAKHSDDEFVSSLTIPGYTGFPVTKKMDEKYLPGAVILYADAENYLYATSDTSDTSKRMTKAELLAASQSGMNMWCYIPGEEGTVLYYQAYAIGFQTDFGVVMNDAGMWYTAEYAPET